MIAWNAHPKRLLACLLTAVLLIVGSSPPGFRHAHAGGHVAHVHTSCHSNPPGHSPADHHALRNAVQSTEAESHGHVFLLGLNTTVPDEEESPHGPAGHSPEQTLILLAGVGTGGVVLSARKSPTYQTVVNIMLEVQRKTIASAQIVCSRKRVLSSLLCDTARHERSGAQLF